MIVHDLATISPPVPISWKPLGNNRDDLGSELFYRQLEYGLVICIGMVGIIGNITLMIVIMITKYLRKSASAFMFHHCVLDLLKSFYCLIFANSLLTQTAPMFCEFLGGSFIVCVTSTAFNILAMVMNEAYVFSDLNIGVRDSGNYCCIIFSVSTIWFASIILNLGVAFLPGNPTFIEKVGHCTFDYGKERYYVLHFLWIVLVTFAIALTAMYLKKFYNDICDNSAARNERLSKIERTCVVGGGGTDENSFADNHATLAALRNVQRYSLRKFYTLLVMTVLFVLSWYPLFMLTLVDHNFSAPPHAYKVLTIFACSNAALNPFIFICLIKRRFCLRYDLPALPIEQEDQTFSPTLNTLDVIQVEENRFGRKNRFLRDYENSSPPLPSPPPPVALSSSSLKRKGIYNGYFLCDAEIDSAPNSPIRQRLEHFDASGSDNVGTLRNVEVIQHHYQHQIPVHQQLMQVQQLLEDELHQTNHQAELTNSTTPRRISLRPMRSLWSSTEAAQSSL